MDIDPRGPRFGAVITTVVLAAVLITGSVWLLGVQLLDGVGAGMYDVLLPLVLADVMRGTGRYSLARGVLGTIQGIGGSTGLCSLRLSSNASCGSPPQAGKGGKILTPMSWRTAAGGWSCWAVLARERRGWLSAQRGAVPSVL